MSKDDLEKKIRELDDWLKRNPNSFEYAQILSDKKEL